MQTLQTRRNQNNVAVARTVNVAVARTVNAESLAAHNGVALVAHSEAVAHAEDLTVDLKVDHLKDVEDLTVDLKVNHPKGVADLIADQRENLNMICVENTPTTEEECTLIPKTVDYAHTAKSLMIKEVGDKNEKTKHILHDYNGDCNGMFRNK